MIIPRYLLLFTLLLFAGSCITISINGYRFLTEEQRSEIRQFGAAPKDDSLGKYLAEITAKDLYTSFDREQYTWVHVWVPYCKSENGKPLFYYDNILETHKNKGLQLFLISNVYNYKPVKQQIQDYGPDVYVIKHDSYGKRTGKNLKAFGWEMMEAGYIDTRRFGGNMIFKGDSLVYQGYKISNAIMDSVIAANP